MRFVASTFLSVAILAFVTQSISAAPAGSNNQVEEVGQESNALSKRLFLYDEFGPEDIREGCIEGLVPEYICYAVFAPGPK